MTLKLGMQHQVLKYYQIPANDVPGLTLTYFMARSNLVPYTFVWDIFSSEAGGPIEAKFYLEALRVGGTTSNGRGHMTKMAAMPIYGKNLKKSSSPEHKGR